MMVVTLLLHNI